MYVAIHVKLKSSDNLDPTNPSADCFWDTKNYPCWGWLLKAIRPGMILKLIKHYNNAVSYVYYIATMIMTGMHLD